MAVVFSLLYDHTVGHLVRGCLSSSPDRNRDPDSKKEHKKQFLYRAVDALPEEIFNLEPAEFVTDVDKENIVFLPTKVLQEICKKLPPRDFATLSQSCRLLHWRMSTFCHCHLNGKLSIYPSNTSAGQISLLYRLSSTEKIVPEETILSAPVFFKQMELILQKSDLSEESLSELVILVEKIRRKGKKLCVAVQGDLEEFQLALLDSFLKETRSNRLRWEEQTPFDQFNYPYVTKALSLETDVISDL